MLRACVVALKAPPVPPAKRFQQYYNRHKALILQSKREISPLLIKQRRIGQQQERYKVAITKLLVPYGYVKLRGDAPHSPNPSEIQASIALLTQAYRTATESGNRTRRLLQKARNGQQEFRTQYHELYRRAQENSSLEAELADFVSKRRIADVSIATLVEKGKRTH
eukprot:GFYU01049159.1.p1 GENE.GFYU01049159.1~~GFYU01049159.1.p1  ORF type:complete len:166 (+),score=10.31 GFYU01049159.1:32-529(+)